MPIHNANITLGTAASLIVGAYHNAERIYLHNMTKSSNEYIYVGGSGITTANSIHIDPGEDMVIDLPAGDELWALSNPDGLEVGILAVRR